MLRLLTFGRFCNNVLHLENVKSALEPQIFSSHSRCNRISFGRGFSTTKSQFSRLHGTRSRNLPEQGIHYNSLIKPFIFSVSVGCISYTASIMWQYESVRKIVKKNRAKFGMQYFNKPYRNDLEKWWNSNSKGMKAVISIMALNSIVFLMWRVPSLSVMMRKYFVASPVGAAPCTSLLLSTFSHQSLLHFSANMYVLWSFAPTITNMLGAEQFVATYTTAAVVSGFASYVVKVIQNSRVPSLGASGAIIALLGMVCTRYPEARLSIAFVDQIFPHSFSASTAMKCLIALDSVGLLLGWKFFDHAAHLSGMFFGLWYMHYGNKIYKEKVEAVAKVWHSIRNKWSKD